MLTNFECNEAKSLREGIKSSLFTFVLNPTMEKDIARLNKLESKCEHSYQDGICVHCGKEQNK